MLRFIKILLNFNESNIHSRHNKNTMSSIIQKNRNTRSNNTELEKKISIIIGGTSLIISRI